MLDFAYVKGGVFPSHLDIPTGSLLKEKFSSVCVEISTSMEAAGETLSVNLLTKM